MALSWKTFRQYDPRTDTHLTVEAAEVGPDDWYERDESGNKSRKTVTKLGHESHKLAKGDVLIKTQNPNVYEVTTSKALEDWKDADGYDEEAERAANPPEDYEEPEGVTSVDDAELAAFREWQASKDVQSEGDTPPSGAKKAATVKAAGK